MMRIPYAYFNFLIKCIQMVQKRFYRDHHNITAALYRNSTTPWGKSWSNMLFEVHYVLNSQRSVYSRNRLYHVIDILKKLVSRSSCKESRDHGVAYWVGSEERRGRWYGALERLINSSTDGLLCVNTCVILFVYIAFLL